MFAPHKNKKHNLLQNAMIVLISSIMGCFAISTSVSAGVAFPYQDGSTTYTAWATTNVGSVLKAWNQEWSFLETMLDLFGINYTGPDKAISYVQILINYALALLWFIALLVILYSFYMIFFGKSDDGVANARKTVVWAAIALLIIGVSWFVVNFLFYIYNQWL